MKAQKQARKNGPREVLTDLCRTGQWVGIAVIAMRMDIGRTGVLSALTELIAKGMVEVRQQPRKWANTQPEKEYRAVAGADPTTIPLVAFDSPGKPYNDEDQIMAVVRSSGRTGAQDVADAVRVSRNHASAVLRRLVDSGALMRSPGPVPPVGGQRPWIYEVAP